MTNHENVTSTANGILAVLLQPTNGGDTIESLNFTVPKEPFVAKIPSNITYIGCNALKGCTNLVGVEFEPNSQLQIIDQGAFAGCNALQKLQIPQSVWKISKNAFVGCDALIETIDGLQYVDSWLIASDKTLEKVTVRQGTIGIADGAFDDCKTLQSITLPHNILYIGNSFRNCYNLQQLNIPDSVKRVCSNFEDCDDLLDTEDGISYLDKWIIVSGGGDIFPYLRDDTVGIADKAFEQCEFLQGICLPDSVVHIGSYAFYGCSQLMSFTLSGSQSKLQTIGLNAFGGCDALCAVEIPESLQFVGACAFPENMYQSYGSLCYVDSWLVHSDGYDQDLSIKSDTIGIAESALCNYDFINTLYIPNSVKYIANKIFNKRCQVKTIFYGGTASQWEAIANSVLLNGATVYFYSEDKPTEQGNYWHYVKYEPAIW